MINMILENGAHFALLYIVISGNYLGNLFSCRVQKLLSSNMILKSILGLATLYFFIVLSSPPEKYSESELILFTLGMYIWFWLTTRISTTFWTPVILIMIGVFVLHTYNQRNKKNIQNDDEEAAAGVIRKIMMTGTAIAIGLTVIGVVIYYGEKKVEYGSSFQMSKFIWGVQKCRGKTPNIPMSKILKALI
jgi:hypothetical protein